MSDTPLGALHRAPWRLAPWRPSCLTGNDAIPLFLNENKRVSDTPLRSTFCYIPPVAYTPAFLLSLRSIVSCQTNRGRGWQRAWMNEGSKATSNETAMATTAACRSSKPSISREEVTESGTECSTLWLRHPSNQSSTNKFHHHH